ncbi:hypothetical protein HOD05_03875 [Candidatus Woesearchaeota archaeon]|nr:hypothetical protein [Candidatus Woesearchaeota archaeon]MBT4150691.1 hypothetical protein [Candidatus Woesearchaeota archaeon]MBT4247909.1 hypothetical protein [Candidatus Woesearchaeota archaeon]MBT4434333.1 hypothetical protein [Candidatus Woesearchaeota archaeon]MBT7332278.1 hypothetical protein [Candidatus Woesearchaeota archaeon]
MVELTCLRDGIDLSLDTLLDQFATDLKKKQDGCSHENTQRWGPSYLLGTYASRTSDSYHCKDCNLTSDSPIGPYRK